MFFLHLKIDNLSFSYTQKLVLDRLSLELNSGDFLTIFGKNGTGKSTFIKCLLKIEKVPDNSIFYNGVDINSIKKFKNFGYVPQKLEFNYEFPITVSEILSSSYLYPKDDFYTQVINILDLNPIYRQNINTLSGGQLQRVFIARSLLNKPSILILDEPTVGVDSDNIKSLYNTLSILKENKVTIIISTHDLEFAEGLSDFSLEFKENGNYILCDSRELNNKGGDENVILG